MANSLSDMLSGKRPKLAIEIRKKDTWIKVSGCGPIYFYKWNKLANFPQFCVTKNILEKGEINEAGFAIHTCHPIVYSHVHLFILCGTKISIEAILKEIRCKSEDIVDMIESLGFGNEIYE